MSAAKWLFVGCVFVYRVIGIRSQDSDSKIINYSNYLDQQGYNFRYETSNGITHNERGIVGDNTITVKGEYSYQIDENTIITVSYIADENGYRPIIRYSDAQRPRNAITGIILKPRISTSALASLTGGGLG
ncbi:endocuticle structural glycoprotein SgAbd-5-like [Cylas formicarius]|uniref:endocuticle structural glycoprotein SgAbd-5-like n=1 Tax=Cylas formicarius TaxID=197179 RepID=UPI0029589E90|nr:endocuticle structural glycoprotein SgAbd-5-like [Cylas formicarius]